VTDDLAAVFRTRNLFLQGSVFRLDEVPQPLCLRISILL
jgi:hypothetical protein